MVEFGCNPRSDFKGSAFSLGEEKYLPEMQTTFPCVIDLAFSTQCVISEVLCSAQIHLPPEYKIHTVRIGTETVSL